MGVCQKLEGELSIRGCIGHGAMMRVSNRDWIGPQIHLCFHYMKRVKTTIENNITGQYLLWTDEALKSMRELSGDAGMVRMGVQTLRLSGGETIKDIDGDETIKYIACGHVAGGGHPPSESRANPFGL